MKSLLTALSTAAALTTLATTAHAQRTDAEWLEQCRDQRHWSSRGDDARFCDVRTTTLGALRALNVDGRENGAVAVRGWDGADIRVSARIQANARSEADAREIASRIRVNTSGGTIHADGPARERGANWSVSYEIMVPRRMDVRVDTHNGPIAVQDVTGRMTLHAQNGPLALRRVGGAVNARVQNGPITVELAGNRWNGEGLDAESVNGPVQLSIPRDYSARLEVGTTHGPVSLDIPLAEGYRGGRHVNTVLGSGGAPIRVVTTNGPLVVRRTDR
ncbi:MAG: hypothetical protein JO040_08605 [Gemmatimonadetes bacterium]|nr:hypothetical protein [Gemmatimonadota bacterium]